LGALFLSPVFHAPRIPWVTPSRLYWKRFDAPSSSVRDLRASSGTTTFMISPESNRFRTKHSYKQFHYQRSKGEKSMRGQNVSALAVMLLGLALGPVSLAQGVPRGTYRQTCQDIRSNGYTLYARCQRVDGDWHNTSINYQNCRGPIINDNGNLRCEEGGGGYAAPGYASPGYGRWQDGLPPGDYKRTCQNLYVDGNKLSATCQRVDGGWNNTSLKNIDRCQSMIVNDDGNLRCQR
jgi:CVNH domain